STAWARSARRERCVSARSGSGGGLIVSAVLGRTVRDPYESRLASQPEIAERVDPVVYASLGKQGPLTREQVSHYDREGFLELDGVLSDAEVRTLVAELNRLRAAPEGIDRDTLILEP